MVAGEVALVMPKMSMTMTEGTFLVWHKEEGDEVREGEVVCEVATDKVDMEVEATMSGTLTRRLAQPEDVVPVGEPLAYVATDADELLGGLFDEPAAGAPPGGQTEAGSPEAAAGDQPVTVRPGEVGGAELSGAVAGGVVGVSGGSSGVRPVGAGSSEVGGAELSGAAAEGAARAPVASSVGQSASARSSAAPEAGRPVTDQPPSPPAARRSVPTRPPAATAQPPAVPAARRRAAERGIPLTSLTPTGPWNTIRLSDVDTAPTRTNPRAAIARRMSVSAHVPQFVLHRDLDLDDTPRTHSWTVRLTHAFATALRRHPDLNASWADGAIQHHDHVGVAIAVDTGHGLLAPVLTDPDLDDLDRLAGRIDDVIARARGGRLRLAELSARATTTVSNLGPLGITGFHALLTPPQATALAVGAVEPRVVPVPGGLGVRLRCTVGLTVDHRVADGAPAARLLATLQEVL